MIVKRKEKEKTLVQEQTLSISTCNNLVTVCKGSKTHHIKYKCLVEKTSFSSLLNCNPRHTHTQKKIFSLCVHVFFGPHSNMDAPEDWHVPPRVRH